MDLNEFAAQITGIAPPWTVISAKLNGTDTVDVEIGYDRKFSLTYLQKLPLSRTHQNGAFRCKQGSRGYCTTIQRGDHGPESEHDTVQESGP